MLDPAAKILVIHVARIGDTLLITPVMPALKGACPQGRLDCLLHPARRALLENLPWVDDLGAITPKTASFRGWFSGKHYDYALVYDHDAPLVVHPAGPLRPLYNTSSGPFTAISP